MLILVFSGLAFAQLL
jgi:hypothetical protein